MNFGKKTRMLLLALSCTGIGQVLGVAPIVPPAGGKDVIAFSDSDTVQLRQKDGKANQKWLPIEAMPFEKAYQIELLAKPKASSDMQVVIPFQHSYTKGDSLLLSFWVRRPRSAGEPGPASLFVQAGPGKARYEFKFSPFREWEQHVRAFKAPADSAKKNGNISIHVGGAGPVIEIASLRLVNYGADKDLSELPESKVTYAGREENAPWRKEALARIEKIRKADLKVKVLDADANPVEGADVRIEMLAHAFRFGNTVDAHILGASEEDFPYTKVRQGKKFVTTWEDAQKYREILRTYFNTATFESELRPHVWKQQTTGNEAQRKKFQMLTGSAIPWLQEHNIDIRGHYLSWGAMDFNAIEKEYLGNPDAHRKWLWAHMADVLSKTEGIVTEWDTINHIVAWGNHTYEKEYGGLEILAEIMAEARRLAPNTKHAINEGKILPDGYKREAYKRVIRFLNEQGQAPDTVGFMAHFALTSLTPPEELLGVYDDFAAIAPRLQLSEFDVEAGDDEQLQADYYRDVMLATFSHPAFHSIVQWGFWENAHWKPYAALWRKDWSLKPAGKVFVDLVRTQWWTDEVVKSNAEGISQSRAFLGDYKVSATYRGKTAVLELNLDHDGKEITITLPSE